MGLMTRDAMRDEIAGTLNRTDLNTLIEGWLDRTLFDLCTYYRFFETETTGTLTLPSGDSTVAVPTDLLTPIRLEYEDEIVTVKDLIYVREYLANSSSGFPDYVARFGANFYFDREADQAYAFTLFYKNRTDAFASGSAVSPIGAEWDEALIVNATAMGYRKLRQHELYDFYRKQYYSYVKGRLPEKSLMEEQWNETFAGDEDEADAYSF